MSNINHFGNNQLFFFPFTTEILTYCSLRNSVNKQEKYWMFPKKFSRLTSKTVAVRNSARVCEIISHIKGTK